MRHTFPHLPSINEAGRTDVEAETPILWPPDAKSWLIWKDPDAGKDWRWEEKGTTEDELVGWHHWFNGHGFRWTPGAGDGLGGPESQRVGHDWATELNECRSGRTPITESWEVSLETLLSSTMNTGSVQLLSRVWLFATPWTASCQASLSITSSRSPPKPMSIGLVMTSNHLILCHPLLLPPSIFPSIRVFSNGSVLQIRCPKYWSFSFSISPSNAHSRHSFRMDLLDLLAVQETLKSLLQHYSSKAPILLHSAFCIVQLSHPYMTTGKTIALTRWTFVGKVMSLLFNMLSSLVITFLRRSKHLLISC